MAAESFDAEEKAHQLTELELLDRTKVDVMKASLESQVRANPCLRTCNGWSFWPL